MRTTVDLERDVEQLLRVEMQRTGQNLETALNDAIRRGLSDTAPSVNEPPFEVHARSMGLRAGLDPAGLKQLEMDLELEAYLEVTRKLAERHAN